MFQCRNVDSFNLSIYFVEVQIVILVKVFDFISIMLRGCEPNFIHKKCAKTSLNVHKDSLSTLK